MKNGLQNFVLLKMYVFVTHCSQSGSLQPAPPPTTSDVYVLRHRYTNPTSPPPPSSSSSFKPPRSQTDRKKENTHTYTYTDTFNVTQIKIKREKWRVGLNGQQALSSAPLSTLKVIFCALPVAYFDGGIKCLTLNCYLKR